MSRKSKQVEGPAFLEYVRTALHYVPETGELLWATDAPDEFRAISGQPATREKVDRTGYHHLVVNLNGCEYIAARLIWFMQTGRWPRHTIDHCNRHSTDNTWDNLRDVTQRVNNRNRDLGGRRRAAGAATATEARG